MKNGRVNDRKEKNKTEQKRKQKSIQEIKWENKMRMIFNSNSNKMLL